MTDQPKPDPEKIIEIFNIPGYAIIDSRSKLGELFSSVPAPKNIEVSIPKCNKEIR